MDAKKIFLSFVTEGLTRGWIWAGLVVAWVREGAKGSGIGVKIGPGQYDAAYINDLPTKTATWPRIAVSGREKPRLISEPNFGRGIG